MTAIEHASAHLLRLRNSHTATIFQISQMRGHPERVAAKRETLKQIRNVAHNLVVLIRSQRGYA
jgi:hypothetical protein